MTGIHPLSVLFTYSLTTGSRVIEVQTSIQHAREGVSSLLPTLSHSQALRVVR